MATRPKNDRKAAADSRRAWALTLCLGLLSFGTPCPVGAADGASAVTPDALPALPLDELGAWQAVGRVNAAGYRRRGMCSGTLIAPDRVLTAAHCVLRDGRRIALGDLHFVAGWLGGDYAAHARIAGVRLAPGAVRDGRIDPRRDIAVLELARPLDIPPLPTGAPGGASFGLVGYHDYRPNRLSGRFDCAGAVSSDILRLDCPVRPGNSGGPVLRRGGNGWQVVGVVSARSNRGTLAALLPPWLQRQID